MNSLKILLLSPEVVPFAKTGGLADVAGALPRALKALGVDVAVMMPFYGMVRGRDFKITKRLEKIDIPLGTQWLEAGVWETMTGKGVPVWLLERDDFFDRPGLYGEVSGDYLDNLERFTFLAHGALKASEALYFKPDVIHCHDWQTGLVPALMKGPYGDAPFFRDTRTVFTIHNLGYQGLFPAEKLPVTGLSREAFFHMGGLEYWGNISLLKSGIVYADAITTVSPKYAEEIQTREYGMGMEGILQQRRASLRGILNGVDYDLWDPAIDAHIAANYAKGEMGEKARCKQALVREMGLASLGKRPLFGVISRLDAQKGLDLLIEIIDDILGLDAGLVVLGSGSAKIERALDAARERHPARVGLKLGFDEALAHRIMAGTDIFLIPSRYEPCGLTQMYALKYGTVPVVRSTGGLEDTVVSFDPSTGEGTGFKFGSYEAGAFLGAIQEAATLFQDKRIWSRVMANGMTVDFSWRRAARDYVELYESILA